jgi:hypothetical protein
MDRTLRLGFLAGLLTMIGFTLVLGAMAAAPVAAPVGDWEGKIDTGNGSLRVVVHIAQADDGKLTGSLDSPDQDAMGIAISSITYKEPDLHFAVESLSGSYQGAMNQDGSTITGEWKQSGLSLPLVLSRNPNGTPNRTPRESEVRSQNKAGPQR